jgi:hypothetical protein
VIYLYINKELSFGVPLEKQLFRPDEVRAVWQRNG